jgi:hypothetical protein
MKYKQTAVAISMILLISQAQEDRNSCPTCSAFPPHQPLDCSAAARAEGGGACLDTHPAQTYCDLRAWLALHSENTEDYDFALQEELIWRSVFSGVKCDIGKPMS